MKLLVRILKTLLGTAFFAGGVYLCAFAYVPSSSYPKRTVIGDEMMVRYFAEGSTFKPLPLSLGVASMLIGLSIYLPILRRLESDASK